MMQSAARADSHGVRSTLTGIEEIVEIDIHMTNLEPDDRSKRSAIGWKSSVTFVDIITIRDGSVDRRGIRRGNLGCTRFWIAPRTLRGSSAIAAFATEFALHKSSNRVFHRLVIRWAERSEQHLVIAFESERIRDHGIIRK
jgi:hypothetical protein